MQGHNFKKQFGQNFLISKRFVESLISPLELSEKDIVVEIGPGDGIVTGELIKSQAFVISIEIDRTLIPRLVDKFGSYDNFKLIEEDIMQTNLPEILQSVDPEFKRCLKITGSLPYNISKDIIKMLLHHNLNGKAKHKIETMSFIVQEEVAKSYVAKPPKATVFAMQSSLFADIKKYESIPKTQFKPTPKVDGGIIAFNLKKSLEENISDIEKFIKIGFSSPRKTLINNFKNSGKYESESIRKSMEISAIPESRRASEMSITEWIDLYKNLPNS